MADDVAGSSALEVSADGSGFVAALDRMTKASEAFERRSVASAGRAGEAASSVGDGAGAAAAKTEAASKRFTTAIEREIAALTLSRAEYRKWQAQQQGISEQVYGPLIARLNAAKAAQDAAAASVGRLGDATEITSRQARLLSRNFGDALRAVDIGGGALGGITQRVSQLGIAFGGFEGLGARISPTIAAVGGLAAAAALAAVAFQKGHAETEAYARALILSGNAAGTTTGYLKELAKAQAQVAGTQGDAAAVLAQLAASGDVAASLLGKATQAAVGLARVGGPAASETARKFADLGRDPVKAVEKLNEAENFLSASIYRQIRALVEQGKSAEAAALAQSTYADALIGRTGQLEQRLGIVERSWRAVTGAAKAAWDAMLNIGREQSLEERLGAVNQRLATFEESARLRARGGKRVTTQEAERQADLGERSAINRSLLNQTEGAIAARTAAQEAKKAIEDANKAITKPVESPYGDIIRDLRKLEQAQEEELRTGGKVSEARKLQIRLIDQFVDKADKLTFAQRRVIAAEIAQRVSTQERIDELQKQVKAEQEYADAEAKAVQQQIDNIAREFEARQKVLAGIDERTQKVADEVQAAEIAAAANISLAEAIEQVAIARLREKAAGAEGDPARLADINAEIAARERLLSALADKRSQDAAAKSAKAFEEAYLRSYDNLSQGLTDALIQGGKSAADYIKGLFRNLVLRPLLEPFVGPIAGVLASAATGAQAGSVTQGAFGQAQQASTLLQAGKTIYEGFASGFANVGTGAQRAYSALFGGASTGGGAGGSYSVNAALIERQAGSTLYGTGGGGTTFGTAASAAAGAVVGVYGGRAISGGYGFGNSGNSTVNAGTAIGAVVGSIVPVIGTAVGAAVGGIIGGLVNRLFGRRAPEVEGRSITGTITGSDFSGSTVADIVERGGVFRSDRRSQQTEAITGDLDKALDEGAKSLSDLAAKYGAALGLPAERLAGVTAQIKVAITDDAAENSKAIEAALQQYADALLGTFADDIEPFRKSGETVAQTIERVGGAMLTINDSLDMLGLRALSTSVEGGRAAVALAELFGDAGTFAQASASYYAAFFSEAERADRATQQITETLGDFGLSVPASREAFRDLVEAQDLTTQSGREAFAALLGVSSAFDALQTAAGDSAQALAEVVAQRKQLEAQLFELQGNTAALRERERAALDESNRALFDQIKALEDQADAAKLAADAAEEAARAAEDLANRQRSIAGGVDSVIGDFLQGPQLAQYFATRIQETLAEGGIESSIPGILGSTRDDILQLWNAVGVDGREAILAAYGAWLDLDEVLRGTARSVATYRSGTLADRIEEARLGSLSPADRIARLRSTEATLFGQLGTADDPVAVAERLTGVITQRLGEEARLRDDLHRSTIDDLEEQLDAARSLRDAVAAIPQFTSELRLGASSPLSAQQQVAEAERLFNSTIVRARGGDRTAVDSLQRNAQLFIDEALAAFGSGPQGARIFGDVTAALEEFASQIGPTIDPQIAALEAQVSAAESTADNTGEALTLLQSIDAALGGRYTSSSASVLAPPQPQPIDITPTDLPVVDAITNGAAASAQASAELRDMVEQLRSIAANTQITTSLPPINQAGFTALIERVRALETIQTQLLTAVRPSLVTT